NYLSETMHNYSETGSATKLKKQCKDEFAKIQELININYQTAAMVKVLTEMGYEVEESTTAADGSQYMRAVEVAA
ncbi:MAG: hypothetical protein HY226_05600, partial [Candidatus Vogelbacteria bacterium]|nr:hypothetical protein [Candidatus Vogelbacteria bacterium]